MDLIKYPYGYMRPPYIQISLRTKLDMRDKSFGRSLADILWSFEPRYAPTSIALDFEKNMPCEYPDDFLKNWCVLETRTYGGMDYDFPKTLHWKNRGSLKCDGAFIHKYKMTTGKDAWGSLMVTFAYRDRVDWKAMFLSLCEFMQPQLGMLHLFTPENCSPNQREANFQSGRFKSLSNPTVPGLGWMFTGGEEFYEETNRFDLEGLDVKRIDYGAYCTLEIAKGADEIVNNLKVFQARRDHLVEIFPLPIVPIYHL